MQEYNFVLGGELWDGEEKLKLNIVAARAGR